MTQQTINLGAGPDSQTGDSLYTAFVKTNENFTELYSVFGANGITSINANVIYSNSIVASANVRAGNLFAYGNVETIGYVVAAGVFYPNGTPVGSLAAIDSNLIPESSNVFTIGSSTNQFTQGYFSTNLTLAGANVTVVNGQLLVNDIPSGNYGNANVANYLPTYTGNLAASQINDTTGAAINLASNNYVQLQYDPTGNYNAGEIVNGSWAYLANGGFFFQSNVTGVWKTVTLTDAGSINADGDVTVGGNLFVGGNITYQNVETGNLEVANTITASGNITASYFLGNGRYLSGIDATSIQNGTSNVKVYANGNVNITTAGNNTWVFGTNGSLTTPGSISTTGNATANYFIGNFVGNISGNISAAGANTQVLFNDSGTVNGTSGLTFNKASNLVTVGGTLSATQVNVAGFNVIDSTGNIVTSQLVNSGVTAGTYGNASSVPSITVDSKGRVTAVSNVAVAGVSNVTYNTTTGNLTVSTSSGTNYVVDLGVGTADSPTFGNVNVTGNITGSYVIGNGAALTSITGANVTGTVANASYALQSGQSNKANTAIYVTGLTGTNVNVALGYVPLDSNATALTAQYVTQAAQANITSVGTLTGLTLSGTLTGTTLNAATIGNASAAIVGNGAALTSITGANVTGTVANASYALQSGQSNKANTAIYVTGLTGTNVNVALGYVPLNSNATALTAQYVTQAAQANITSVGTLTGLTLSGTLTGTTVQAATIGNTGASLIGNGAALTSLTGAAVTGTVANASYALQAGQSNYANTATYVTGLTGTNVNVALGYVPLNSNATALTAQYVTQANQANITSVGTLTGLTLSGGLIGTTLNAATIGNATTTFTGLNYTASGTFNGPHNGTLGTAGGNTAIVSTLSATGAATVNSLQVNNSATVGNTLTVGGLATINSFYANTNSIVGANLTILGNLIVSGNVVTSGSNNVSFTDSIIELHTLPNLANLTYDDGKDIGLRFHFYKTQNDDAFLGWANDSGYLEWYGRGATETGNVINGVYGTIKSGALILANSTPSSGLNTGVLQANGGASISGNIYANGIAYLGSGTAIALSNPLLVATTTANTYTQIQIQNQSNGSAASSDFIATADDGTDTIRYIDMGINGSGWNQATWTVSGARDGYLYTSGVNLTVGTDTLGKTLKIHTGGLLAANVVATFNDAGTASTSSTTGALVLTGGVGVLGAVNGGSTLGIVGNATVNALTVNATATIGSSLSAAGGLQATPIGNAAASTGQFTTVSATGNVTAAAVTSNASITAITTISALGGIQATPVGNVTPSTALFTTAGTSGNLTASALTVNGTATVGSTLGVTGNINGSSLTLSGSEVITGSSQIKGGLQATPIGNVSPSTALFTTIGASSNATVAALTVNGTATIGSTLGVTGNVTAPYFIGNFSGNISGNISAAGANTQVLFNDAGTVNGDAGLTFNKTTDTLIVGTINAATIGNTNAIHIGNGAALTSLTGANVAGTVANATYALQAGQSNYANTATYVTGLTGTNVNVALGYVPLNSNATALTAQYVTQAAQANITSVGTLTGLTLSGTLTGTTVNAATIGNTSATLIGNGAAITSITGANVTGTVALATTATYVTGLTGTNVNVALGYVPLNSNATALTAQYVTQAAQANITSVGTLTGLTLSGTLTGTTLNAATIGNVNSLHIGNGSALTSLTGANVTGTVANASYALQSGQANYANTATYVTGLTGTNVNVALGYVPLNSNATALTAQYVTQAAQANITSVGTLTGLTLSGALTGTTVNAATIGNTGAVLIGNGAAITSITGANITGTVANTSYALQAGQSNYANTATYVTGLTGANVNVALGYVPLNSNATALTAQYVTQPAQANITSVGTLTGLTLSGTLTGTTVNAATIGNAGAVLIGNGAALTSITGANVTGTVANASYALQSGQANYANTATYVTGLTGTNVNVALGYVPLNSNATALTAQYVTQAAQANITSVGTLTGLTLSGTLTGTTVNAATIGNTGAAYIGSTLTISGNAVVGNLDVLGNVTYINSTVTDILDPILELNTAANGAPLSGNAPYDSGIKTHYWDGSADRQSFFGRTNDTGNFEFYSNVTSETGNVVAGTYGTIKTGNIVLTGTGSVSSTLAVGANATVNGLTVNTSATIGSTLRATGNVTAPYFIGNIIGNITGNITSPGSNTQIIFNDGGLLAGDAGLTFNKSTDTLVSGTVNAATIGNTGAAIIGATLTTTANATLSNLTVNSSATIGTTLGVTGNVIVGNITTAGLIKTTSTLVATSNVTGAVQVSGGVGVAGNVYVGQRVGWVAANSVSAVYQVYNAATNSLDTIFG